MSRMINKARNESQINDSNNTCQNIDMYSYWELTNFSSFYAHIMTEKIVYVLMFPEKYG